MINVLKLSSVILILIVQASYADVAIIKTPGVAVFDEARNGFSSICFEAAKEFTLQDDLSNHNEITTEIRSGKYQLVFALGARAAEYAKKYFPNFACCFLYGGKSASGYVESRQCYWNQCRCPS